MQHKRPPVQVIVVVVLVLLVAGYYIFQALAANANNVLKASGTIETTQISIGPEISGKVAEVLVREGAPVKSGDVLFRLDDTLLQAQRQAALAGVDIAKAASQTADAAAASAQAQYDIASNVALTQDKAPARTAGWVQNQPEAFNLPVWYFSQSEQITAAQAEVQAAQAALSDAGEELASVQGKVSSADFVKAESDLATAQARYQVANNLNNRVRNGRNIDDLSRRQLFLLSRDAYLQSKGVDPKWILVSNMSTDLRDAAKKIFDDANANLKAAQSAYDKAVTSQGAKDVTKARATVSIVEERYYTALDYLRTLQTGIDAPSVTAAQRVLDQGRSAAAQAKTAINQAQANLQLINAQLAKLTVKAPLDGVILTRNVEPGEFVQPGAAAILMADLSQLTITVYIPEDRYGEVSLGQQAEVSVDSFPGVTFAAEVVQVSDQAEFTPRNVQTVEGRSSTVFAIKLSVNDPKGQLKPGMPADVVFKSSENK